MLNEEIKDELNQPEKKEITSSTENSNQASQEEATVDASVDETLEEVAAVYDIDADGHEENQDLALLSKEELVVYLEKVAQSENLSEMTRIAKEAKLLFDQMIKEEQEAALEKFIEDGNDKDDFQMKVDEYRLRFREAFDLVQKKRNENRLRIEADKQKNLATKQALLDELKEITEKDETEESLKRIKEIQTAWKKIRAVPIEFNQELWDKYKFYLDKFYDNLSINYELKELDRQKNLSIKIELIKKTLELLNETSIKKAMNALNKYHDEWKHTGPIPKFTKKEGDENTESEEEINTSEDLWNRFKEASDKVYEAKKTQLDALKEERLKNLQLKTALIEQLEQIATLIYEKPKDWIEKTQSINTLFEDWKKIGPVPAEKNDQIWSAFKDLRNHFYRQKNIYFKGLNKEKSENLKLKETLCEKAEKLKDSEDWIKTTNELIRLQAEWKKIGPTTEKTSEEVWKRFRSACDQFFSRKDEHFKGRKDEELQNLEAKRALIERLKVLDQNPEVESVFKELREIQKEWSSIGFVPFKNKNEIQKSYSELADGIYNKFRKHAGEMNEIRQKEHYEELASLPEGKKKLQNEERRLRDRIRLLKSDIETLENNIGFFSNSKNASPLIAGIKDKIEKANGMIEKLEKELKLLKGMA